MNREGLQFDFEWRITLFTLLLLPLFIGLGFWQLDRAEEKRMLAAAHESRQRQAPAPLAALPEAMSDDALAYLPVQLEGRFDDERYFLLDNRIHKGKFGYEVLVPFYLEGRDGPVLVNRGWVEGDPARRSLPELAPTPGEQQLRGHVYVPPGEAYLLAEQQLRGDWPVVLQAVETHLVEGALGQALGFAHVIRLEAGQQGALVVNWQIVNVSPEKHTGYAVQWFAMAFALAVLFFLRSSNLWQLLRGDREETEF